MADDESSPEEEVVVEKPKKAAVPWIPLVLVLLFIPIITLLLVEFVVIPKLKSSLLEAAAAPTASQAMVAAAAAEAPAEESQGGGGHGGGHGKPAPPPAGSGTKVTFEDIISNVSGTMGTRFLKVSFQIVSKDPQLATIVKMRDAQVRDAIISTLSSRTIQEIEVIGGRNALRVALISAINGAIGLNLVEDLFFLDFIIQ